MVVAGSFQGLVLRAFDYVESNHFILYFLLQLFKVYDELITILVEGRSILALDKTMHLEFLVDHCFNLLHRLED